MLSPVSQGDPYEQLIAQTIAIERQPQFALKGTLSEQKIFKGVLSDFDSKLSALNSSIEKLTDGFTNPFAARGASVPDDAGYGVSVTDEAVPGSYSLNVERLASTDTRVSKQFGSAGTSLRAFFDTNGAQTFDIDVFSPTDDEPDRRVAISVTVDGAGDTDGDILGGIRTAINDAMSAAVSDETIRSEDAPSASVVNETSDLSRLTLRSGGTGYDNRFAFSDSANGLLGLLEVSRDGLSSDGDGTGGGQITAVGTDDTTSELNARFELNGLTLYRSSNEVDDALEGATISLEDVGETSTFSIGSDAKSVAGSVEDFIKKYNETLDYIASRSKIDAEADTRGDFAGDTAIRGLRFGMRNDLVQSVADQPDGIGTLTDLGIEVEDDGTLKLADKDALREAVERDPDAVQNLFADEEDGLGTRLAARLDSFLGTDGIIKSRQDSTDARIKRLDRRIERWDTRLASREDQLRQQYAKFQETMAVLQGQFSSISSFLGFY